MIQSMTGFGRGEAPFAGGGVTAEVRSVNGRHLDLRVRLPRELQALEAAVRSAVAARFGRGQVDVNVHLAGEEAVEPAIQVSEAAVRGYLQAAERLAASLGIERGLTLAELLPLPGVTQLREPELDASAAGSAVAAAVERACEEALAMRRQEGQQLAADLADRLARVERAVASIEARAGEVQTLLRERLSRRVAALAPELALDPARLEQEVVFYADRMDVTEETVRLRSHVAQFRAALDADGPVGRRLEFLLQEMVREANTIGSKAQDALQAGEVIEIKTELERVREQTLNVE